MSLKSKESRYPKAEEFLISMANSVPGCGHVTSADDVEGIVRRFSEYLASRLDAEDVDSVLEVLDGALRHEGTSASRRSQRRTGNLPRTRLSESYQEPDPYFWG